MAIRSFRCTDTERLFCSETERLFEGRGVPQLESVLRPALRKLAMISAAVKITDIANPAQALQMEATATTWTLRIDDRFVVRFRWRELQAEDVEIVPMPRPVPGIRPLPRVVIYPHPGEILRSEFCEPFVVSQRRLSAAIAISRHRLRQLIDGRIALGVPEAEGLAEFFGTTSAFWIHLQSDHDRALAKDALAETLGRRDLPIE